MTREEREQKHKEWIEKLHKADEEGEFDFCIGTRPPMTWEELNTPCKTVEEWTELAKKEKEAKAAAEANAAGQ